MKVLIVLVVVALTLAGCGESSDDQSAKPSNSNAKPQKQADTQGDTFTDLSDAQSILVEINQLFAQGTSGDCSVLPEIEAKLEQYDRVLDRLAKSDLDLADLRANRIDIESEYSKATALCDLTK